MSLKQARALSRWTYANAKRECEGSVVRWEYATFDRYSLEPHYFERHRFRRGDVLARPGKKAYANGFDAEGMLRVERSPVEFEGQCYETFHAPRDGGIARRHFDYSPEKRPINSTFFEVEDGRIVRCDTVYARGARATEIFHWDRAGRLASVDCNTPDGKHREVMIWDSRGLARVDWVEDGRRFVNWRRVERDLASMRSELEKGLVGAIEATLAKEKKPFYAVGIWWCEDEYQHRFPANLAIATEPKHDPSPVEWGDGERIISMDRALARLCEDASNSAWQDHLQTLADEILLSVAKKLRTKKRMVYAVEVDARKSVRAQIRDQLGGGMLFKK